MKPTSLIRRLIGFLGVGFVLSTGYPSFGAPVITATNNSGALWSAQAGRRSDHGPRYRPTSNISPSRLQFNIFQNLAIRRDSLIL
jgi:hypothetical protein